MSATVASRYARPASRRLVISPDSCQDWEGQGKCPLVERRECMCTVSTLTTNFAKKGPLVTLATICAPVDKTFHLVKPFVLVVCHCAKIPEIINFKI